MNSNDDEFQCENCILSVCVSQCLGDGSSYILGICMINKVRVKSGSVSVTKVTFHLPPTATHFLGEWTLPSRALVLCSSDVPDVVIQWRWRWGWEIPWREDEDKIYHEEKMKMNFCQGEEMKKKMSTVMDYLNCILDLYRLIFSDVHCLYMGKSWGKSREFSVWDSSVSSLFPRLFFCFFFSSSMSCKPGNVW